MKITLCGSNAFRSEMDTIADELRKAGHEVEVPLLPTTNRDQKMSLRDLIDEYGGVDALPLDHPIWTEKSDTLDNHFAKITASGAILVVNYTKRNIEGYVGGNTLMEIALAYYLKKKIYLLRPVSSEMSYKEEILATHPTIINEDLSLVQNG